MTIRGAVIRTGTVKPFCTLLAFKCYDCKKHFVVEQPEGRFVCPSNCHTKDCMGKSFEPVERHKSVQFEMFRKIRIQDTQHDDVHFLYK